MSNNILYELRQKLLNIRNYQKTLIKGKDDDLIKRNKEMYDKIFDSYLNYSFKYLQSRKLLKQI